MYVLSFYTEAEKDIQQLNPNLTASDVLKRRMACRFMLSGFFEHEGSCEDKRCSSVAAICDSWTMVEFWWVYAIKMGGDEWIESEVICR